MSMTQQLQSSSVENRQKCEQYYWNVSQEQIFSNFPTFLLSTWVCNAARELNIVFGLCCNFLMFFKKIDCWITRVLLLLKMITNCLFNSRFQKRTILGINNFLGYRWDKILKRNFCIFDKSKGPLTVVKVFMIA